MSRKITFTNIGVINGSRVWRNHETGVEVIKGANFAEVGLYYVCEPIRDSAGRAVVSCHTTLKAARSAATAQAAHWRSIIAQAHLDAIAGHAIIALPTGLSERRQQVAGRALRPALT